MIIIAIGSFGTEQFLRSDQQSQGLELGKFLVGARHFCLARLPILRGAACHSQWEQPFGTVECRRSCGGRYLRNLVGDRRVDLRVEHALFGGCARPEHRAWNVCRFRDAFPGSFWRNGFVHGDGLVLLIGVCITLAGIAVIGYAGSLRARNMTEEEKKAAVKDFALTKGLLVALLAGVMSACFNLGAESGARSLRRRNSPAQANCSH